MPDATAPTVTAGSRRPRRCPRPPPIPTPSRPPRTHEPAEVTLTEPSTERSASARETSASSSPSSASRKHGHEERAATYGRITDLVAAFGGPLVEAAAHHIRRTGKPAIVVRTDEIPRPPRARSCTRARARAPARSPTSLTRTTTTRSSSRSWPAAHAARRASQGLGRRPANYGATIALGTDTSIDITDAGDVTLDLGAGTLVAGDTYAFRTTAPMGLDRHHARSRRSRTRCLVGHRRDLRRHRRDALRRDRHRDRGHARARQVPGVGGQHARPGPSARARRPTRAPSTPSSRPRRARRGRCAPAP